MIIIDTNVANAMADYQRKYGKRMTMKEIKRIANVETETEETKNKKQSNKLF